MIKFNIDYVCSPNAVAGLLYYRFVKPDGTFSNWVVNNTLGPFPIDTQSGTVTLQTLTDVAGNPPDFLPNIVYQFYIEQECRDGSIVDSPISNDIWGEECPVYVTTLTSYNQGSYGLNITLYDLSGPGNPMNPLAYSVLQYNFEIFEDTGTTLNSLGVITVPYTDIVVGSPQFDIVVTSSDLAPPGIVSSSNYVVKMEVLLVTSTGTVSFLCDNGQVINILDCNTYKVYIAGTWIVEWTDCSGQTHKVGNKSTSGGQTEVVNGNVFTYFFICAQTIPIGLGCTIPPTGPPATATVPTLTGNLIVPATPAVGTTSQPPSITNTLAYNAGWNSTLPPGTTLSEGALIQLPPGPGCDSTYNGIASLTNQGVLFFQASSVGPC